MKYTMEMKTEEFVSMMNLFEKIVDAVHCSETLRLEHNHEKNMVQLRKEAGQRRHTFIVDEGDDDSDEDSDEDLFSAGDPISPPPAIHFTVHSTEGEGSEGGPFGVKEGEKAIVNGRIAFADLVKFWLVDFCWPPSEDAPASSVRGDEMKRLSIAKDGRRMLTYLQAATGLTAAVEAEWPEEYNSDKIRYVAENMAQVGSILFSEVADFLEYPNPLED